MAIALSREDAMVCCASEAFAEKVAMASPFESSAALLSAARRIWWTQVCDIHATQQPTTCQPFHFPHSECILALFLIIIASRVGYN